MSKKLGLSRVREHSGAYGVSKRRIKLRRDSVSEKELRAAKKRLMKFAGCFGSGDPHSADNDKIDTDLAREYANNHEDE